MKSAGRRYDLSAGKWHSSSYSGGHNECVEIADGIPHLVPVRDSKNPTGPVIVFTHQAWRAFLATLC
ncbi:DUF397 domain-containing protein [Streptomyces sp. NPDC003077]|uniref:DUF397 domain-containing protein n=1 Tax=Streptomyces sp. NPDC003077 TaxID=3154443 RepID=UPI0033B3FCA9